MVDEMLRGPDCILWKGGQSMGYGIINVPGGQPMRVHRFVYLAFVGSIPVGNYHVHHKCHTKLCINLDHLEVLKVAEHRKQHRLGTCKRGHALEGANLYIRPDNGKRQCIECLRIRASARHHRLHPDAAYYPNRGPRRSSRR